jgi:NAD(P)-dependent dehydrogenase (short-subunit alcohol dehydrogenase family)
MPRMLTDKVAVVTGGAMGNGEGIARVMAAEGAVVCLWDVSATVFDTARSIEAAGGRSWAVRVDISDGLGVEAAAAEVFERHGRADILVNNAAIAPEALFIDMTPEMRERVWRVNVGGTMNCTHALLPPMIRQRYGKIVTVSSVTGPLSAIPGLTMYAATKGALLGFTRNLAIEVAQYGINVNAILPGTIDTPLFRGSFGLDGPDVAANEAKKAAIGAPIPWGRVGTMAEIGGVAAFLASEWSDYVTGTEIVVDGGNRLVEWGEHPAH